MEAVGAQHNPEAWSKRVDRLHLLFPSGQGKQQKGTRDRYVEWRSQKLRLVRAAIRDSQSLLASAS